MRKILYTTVGAAASVDITPKELAAKVNRGAFSAVFLVQIFMALGADEIWIERLRFSG